MRRPTENDSPSPIRWERAGVRVSVPQNPNLFLHESLVLHFINTTTFVAPIFGFGEARRGSIPRSGAVTEEQRGQNRKATQPSGRRFFSAQTSLLAPYRPLKGMRVARASSGPKIPRRKRGCIYEMGYLIAERVVGAVVIGHGPQIERIQQAPILDET